MTNKIEQIIQILDQYDIRDCMFRDLVDGMTRLPTINERPVTMLGLSFSVWLETEAHIPRPPAQPIVARIAEFRVRYNYTEPPLMAPPPKASVRVTTIVHTENPPWRRQELDRIVLNKEELMDFVGMVML